jgi:hypothetical protein
MEMKKNAFSYSRMAAAIVIIATVTCSVAWLSPSFAVPKNEKPIKGAITPAKQPEKVALPLTDQREANQLMLQMLHDGIIDESKGFVVERKENILLINGQPQSAAIAKRYLTNIKQQTLRFQVYSLQERMRLHPQSGILQMVAPVMFSSPCIDNNPVKPGC